MINKKIENQSNDSLFFTRSNLDNSKVDKIVSDALHKADDGELFMEFCESESFVYKALTFTEFHEKLSVVCFVQSI